MELEVFVWRALAGVAGALCWYLVVPMTGARSWVQRLIGHVLAGALAAPFLGAEVGELPFLFGAMVVPFLRMARDKVLSRHGRPGATIAVPPIVASAKILAPTVKGGVMSSSPRRQRQWVGISWFGVIFVYLLGILIGATGGDFDGPVVSWSNLWRLLTYANYLMISILMTMLVIRQHKAGAAPNPPRG